MGLSLHFLILPSASCRKTEKGSDSSVQIYRRRSFEALTEEEQLRYLIKTVHNIDGAEFTVDHPVQPNLEHAQKCVTGQSLTLCSPFAWFSREDYDVVNPFGDSRQAEVDTLWIIDFPNDAITVVNRDGRRSSQLSRLLEHVVYLEDFVSSGPAVPVYIQPSINQHKEYWKPDVPVDHRARALVHRILGDFDFNWRHVLRADYNRKTLRVLARAVLRLSTLKFRVLGGLVNFRIAERFGHVSIQELPLWKSQDASIILVGNTWVVICQSLQDGYLIALDHSQYRAKVDTTRVPEDDPVRPHYMLMSIKGIALCRVTKTGEMVVTRPEPLLNGNREATPPSDLALDQLLWATSASRITIPNPLSHLPVEIQDKILLHVSGSSVAAAKIGCHLAIGSPFSWKQRGAPFDIVHFGEVPQPRPALRSHIWFNDRPSRIVYDEITVTAG